MRVVIRGEWPGGDTFRRVAGSPDSAGRDDPRVWELAIGVVRGPQRVEVADGEVLHVGAYPAVAVEGPGTSPRREFTLSRPRAPVTLQAATGDAGARVALLRVRDDLAEAHLSVCPVDRATVVEAEPGELLLLAALAGSGAVDGGRVRLGAGDACFLVGNGGDRALLRPCDGPWSVAVGYVCARDGLPMAWVP